MHYYTQKDIQVTKLYKSKGINSITDLSIENLSSIFQIHVEYSDGPSKCYYEDDFAVIYLNKNQPKPYIRKDFFHELTHVLFHYGDQQVMNEEFKSLQEEQARRIAHYTSMPRHIFEPLMLKYQSLTRLTELFELPAEMLKERINMFRSEHQMYNNQQTLLVRRERLRKKSLQPGKVYDSTITILNQLKNQVGEENINYEVKRLLR